MAAGIEVSAIYSRSSTAAQVSDAILDACLEQDPLSKVGHSSGVHISLASASSLYICPAQASAATPALTFPVRLCVWLVTTAASKVGRTCIRVNVRTQHLILQVACETATKTGMVMVFGEITTKAKVNYEEIVRKTCKGIGFTSEDVGLDADNCKVHITLPDAAILKPSLPSITCGCSSSATASTM